MCLFLFAAALIVLCVIIIIIVVVLLILSFLTPLFGMIPFFSLTLLANVLLPFLAVTVIFVSVFLPSSDTQNCPCRQTSESSTSHLFVSALLRRESKEIQAEQSDETLIRNLFPISDSKSCSEGSDRQRKLLTSVKHEMIMERCDSPVYSANVLFLF